MLFRSAISAGFEGKVNLDLNKDRLPFGDGEVDFLYTRHTLEDLRDPEWALSEIMRVSKQVWIETPSPLAELSRGVDAYGNHLGYAHHRWIFGEIDGVITLVAKYPILERMIVRTDTAPLEWEAMWDYVYSGPPCEFKVFENEPGFLMGKGLGVVNENDLPVAYAISICDRKSTRLNSSH